MAGEEYELKNEGEAKAMAISAALYAHPISDKNLVFGWGCCASIGDK